MIALLFLPFRISPLPHSKWLIPKPKEKSVWKSKTMVLSGIIAMEFQLRGDDRL